VSPLVTPAGVCCRCEGASCHASQSVLPVPRAGLPGSAQGAHLNQCASRITASLCCSPP